MKPKMLTGGISDENKQVCHSGPAEPARIFVSIESK